MSRSTNGNDRSSQGSRIKKADPALVEACRARQNRLRRSLPAAGVDALLVSNPKDIRYLTGFFSGDCLLLVMDLGAALISDVRDEEAMQPTGLAGLAEVTIGIQHRLPVTVAELCRRKGVHRLGVQSEHLTLAARTNVAAQLGAVAMVESTGLITALRIRKDEIELENIQTAIGIHQAALAATLEQLQVGMKEIELCAILEYQMRQRGADGTSFSTMVSSGARSSVIHYTTSRLPIKPGALLIDWGALVNGYCSDMTRTFGVGGLPPKMKRIYQIVLEAQMAAIDAVGPWKTCAQVDAVARSIIERAGFGEQFGHGLGHGLGLDIHEAPYLNRLATDVRLEPGMVITVEPGIYVPGIGGVRIEDDVLVTEDGCRVLTSFPKGLDEAIIEPRAARRKAGTVRRPARPQPRRARASAGTRSGRRG